MCVIGGLPGVSRLREHDAEGEANSTSMRLCTVALGHGDGWRGHRAVQRPFAAVRSSSRRMTWSPTYEGATRSCEWFNPSPNIALRRGGGEPLELPGARVYRREGSRF